MEKAIKKAIEGGYADVFALIDTYQGIPPGMMQIMFNRCILDPKFWQALCMSMDDGTGAIPDWRDRWYGFITHRIDGGEVEEFFSKLLNCKD